MSLVDEARAVRERIVARLRELEPLVREYDELRQVAAEMGLVEPPAGIAPASDGQPAQGPDRQPARAERRLERRQPAGDGELTARVLAAVSSDPGRTVADYAQLLGLSPTVLYRPVRRLTTEGALVKRGRQLFTNP